MWRILIICMMPFAVSAQGEPYIFSLISEGKAGPVENQGKTGTCWSFATVSFMESEVHRKTGQLVDLSEMYNVRMTYPRKVESYVRRQGKTQFSMGGLSHDVLDVIREVGVMPESVYGSTSDGYDHGTLDAVMEGLAKTIVEKRLYASGPGYLRAVYEVLDGYLGETPSMFEFNGKSYTPVTFRDALGIRTDEYVGLTSFTHRPYYAPMVVEVPDNWSQGAYYNLPMDELMDAAEQALKSGYTVSWDADVSEPGFLFKEGLALMPVDVSSPVNVAERVAEWEPDPARRQQWYEMQETTDDHLMHITGLARDHAGYIYFVTKNSWGTQNRYSGYQYISRPYFYYKTISIYLHRDALSPSLKKKLGI
jgi:bleomycin hydrolase